VVQRRNADSLKPSATLAPMLASLAGAPLEDSQLVYEPKYDGIRAIAEIGGPGSARGTAAAGRAAATKGRRSAPRTATRPLVRLWSRLGNDKTSQFPEIAAALGTWAAKRKAPVVLDGEIVALDANGQPTGFQQLQGRIHLIQGQEPAPGAGSDEALPAGARVAFIAFDILSDGNEDLRDRPLLERRAALERAFGRTSSPLLRISEMVQGDGRALYQRALDQGWEGLIAKHAASLYRPGKRTPDWRKLKIVHEQEFVIGGWTEPRQSREYFGALLLGVYEDSELVYVGHTGTGFNERELARVMRLLKPLEIKEAPFRSRPRTNERAHWVKPTLVAQIKFTEWTADAKLRHPVYLGLRDDKRPADVRREERTPLHAGSVRDQGAASNAQAGASRGKPQRAGSRDAGEAFPHSDGALLNLAGQLRALEDSHKDGVLDLPGGEKLSVSNLHKVFWPRQKLTKGDLLRYYTQVAPFMLPAVADRPLVMKRFPNGIAGQPFYQHRAPAVPEGIRVETLAAADKRPQIVGGGLKTLLYMAQLAAISQDPWFSRVQTVRFADHAALDLDPAEGLPFSVVRDVARWIHDELDLLGALGVPKTSGADGLHVYVPLPPDTPYDAGLIFCQIVATVVAHKHPKIATVERAVRSRGARVYVDYLQNILGKTLATAYSARASGYAGVSTPLTWQELDDGVDREDFTIVSTPARLKRVGDLWRALRGSAGIDLSRVERYADRAGMRIEADKP
jgi:bifunctional non-homologous end joining protein LigD